MTAREWMAQGTKLLLSTVDGMRDDEFAAPSLLPAWRRAHVVAHVHFNADALRRLVRWARTGDRTPMYADAGQRSAEIDHGATLPPQRLRELVHASAEALITDFAELPDHALTRIVVTAQGRGVPASEIAWLRAREVMVHAVDLDRGVGFADLPGDLTAALLADVVAKRHAAGEGAALAAWLTGRTDTAPTLGLWL